MFVDPNAPKELNIEERRLVVANLRVQGNTLDEIAELLVEKGFVNNKGERFSKNTICKDVKAIRKSWVEKYADEFEDMQKRHYLQIVKLSKIFWQNEDWDRLLKLLAHERKVLGLESNSPSIEINATMALPVITITCDEGEE